MFLWTIQTIIISIILIFLVHHLVFFFKSTLTVPKIKDLVNSPTQKYEEMYNIITNANSDSNSNANYVDNTSTMIQALTSGLLPKPSTFDECERLPVLKNNTTSSMKNELKSFLKTKMKNTTPINRARTDKDIHSDTTIQTYTNQFDTNTSSSLDFSLL